MQVEAIKWLKRFIHVQVSYEMNMLTYYMNPAYRLKKNLHCVWINCNNVHHVQCRSNYFIYVPVCTHHHIHCKNVSQCESIYSTLEMVNVKPHLQCKATLCVWNKCVWNKCACTAFNRFLLCTTKCYLSWHVGNGIIWCAVGLGWTSIYLCIAALVDPQSNSSQMCGNRIEVYSTLCVCGASKFREKKILHLQPASNAMHVISWMSFLSAGNRANGIHSNFLSCRVPLN